MAYSDQIRQRAMELSEGSSAREVQRLLEREFPNEFSTPDERTIRRWHRTKPAIHTDSEQERIPLSIPENQKEHNERLADVAKSLLDNDLSSVLHGWTTKRVTGQVKYILTRKGKVGKYCDLTEQQLSERLKKNIVSTEHKYERWFFHDCFLPHLESELPEELKTKGFFDIVKEQPYELIEILRVLAARGIFKGTCPVCEDYHTKTGGL